MEAKQNLHFLCKSTERNVLISLIITMAPSPSVDFFFHNNLITRIRRQWYSTTTVIKDTTSQKHVMTCIVEIKARWEWMHEESYEAMQLMIFTLKMIVMVNNHNQQNNLGSHNMDFLASTRLQIISGPNMPGPCIKNDVPSGRNSSWFQSLNYWLILQSINYWLILQSLNYWLILQSLNYWFILHSEVLM